LEFINSEKIAVGAGGCGLLASFLFVVVPYWTYMSGRIENISSNSDFFQHKEVFQLKSLFSLTFGQEFAIFKTVFEKSVVKESNSIGEMRRVLADF
jgi:uncharacterized FAD-dependent dehydrogenase